MQMFMREKKRSGMMNLDWNVQIYYNTIAIELALDLLKKTNSAFLKKYEQN